MKVALLRLTGSVRKKYASLLCKFWLRCGNDFVNFGTKGSRG
jgi:hypothetical protein